MYYTTAHFQEIQLRPLFHSWKKRTRECLCSVKPVNHTHMINHSASSNGFKKSCKHNTAIKQSLFICNIAHNGLIKPMILKGELNGINSTVRSLDSRCM